jgi:hypothetical protein
MPLQKGRGRAVISENIREFHTGKTYARTKAKYGADVANRQAVAAAYSAAGESRKPKKKRKHRRRPRSIAEAARALKKER